jgi:hypothetical protein
VAVPDLDLDHVVCACKPFNWRFAGHVVIMNAVVMNKVHEFKIERTLFLIDQSYNFNIHVSCMILFTKQVLANVFQYHLTSCETK